jgi:hypothetical protein
LFRTRKVKDTDGTWKATKTGGDGSNVVNSQPGTSRGNAVPDSSNGPYVQRINNDAREDEMEENMQAVGSVLSNLKNMAQDMGNEISNQNKRIDRINVKVFYDFFKFDFVCFYIFVLFLGRDRGCTDCIS